MAVDNYPLSHGSLAQLDEDQHPQYLTGARGDAAYVRKDGSTVGATPLRIVRSGKDANDIFTTVEHHRVGGNLAMRSVLSGGTSPTYTTRTVTEFGLDGTTVLRTITYTLTYDGAQMLTSETAVIS